MIGVQGSSRREFVHGRMSNRSTRERPLSYPLMLERLCAPMPGSCTGFQRTVTTGTRARMYINPLPPTPKSEYHWNGKLVWYCKFCRWPQFNDWMLPCAFCQQYCCRTCMVGHYSVCPSCFKRNRLYFAPYATDWEQKLVDAGRRHWYTLEDTHVTLTVHILSGEPLTPAGII